MAPNSIRFERFTVFHTSPAVEVMIKEDSVLPTVKYDLPFDKCHERPGLFNLVRGNRSDVPVQDRQVGLHTFLLYSLITILNPQARNIKQRR